MKKPKEGTVPCQMCGEVTVVRGTPLCNSCWELDLLIPQSRWEQEKLIERVNNYRTWREERRGEEEHA